MVFPHPVFVVGSYGPDGVPNLATASWAGICCSRPPAVAVSFRPATLTHGNIARRGAFTLNIPSVRHAREADLCGVLSGRAGDKFAACGLHPERAEMVDAPRVAEFPVCLECRVLHSFELGLHTQYVGEILDVLVDPAVLDAEGRPDMRLVAPLVYSSADRSYYEVGGFVARAFAAAKAGS
jgi:flavin reductase (DIM6/NTAB) family NADH-FMN oxidoreductase RutF